MRSLRCWTTVLVTGAAWLSVVGSAAAEDVLGIPCTAGDGVRTCIGNGMTTRVPTWDGVPLDVDVTLPPASTPGPYPTIVYLHGFGASKGGAEPELARQGYAVVQYSARGFGQSCGLPASRGDAGCARGWTHLADVAYEPRDTQYLLGLLADAGVTDPARIGVTGTSYGAGQSLLLATLKDRVALADGSFIPWRSPKGTPMRIAAAAPNWPWSDLASMLVPDGSTLDYTVNNPYGPRIGVAKLSYVGLLTAAGGTLNYFAPPGVDFGSDAYTWIGAFTVGEPYGALQQRVIDEIRNRHSALGVDRGLPRDAQEEPAPVFANASWPDDLTTPTEIFRWRNAMLARWPGAEVDVLLSDGAGHPRASLLGKVTQDLSPLQHVFWDRHLKGAANPRVGVRTLTQACGGDAVRGPFVTRTWAEQHPGEVRYREAAGQSVSSMGDPATGALTDPVANAGTGSCVTTPAVDAPTAATYRLPAAPPGGWTVVGSPTVVARIAASSESAQLAARLWDIAPNGTQTLMARLSYQPRLNDTRPQVFQLHPTGWFLAEGHVAKLELLGSDQPYVRQSNRPFTFGVSDLELRLPVRERPGSRPGVEAPGPLLARDGSPLPASDRFVEEPAAAVGCSTTKLPAKMRVLRAGVRRERLDVLAALTKRATGSVEVTYRSGGARVRFDARVKHGRIRFLRTLRGRAARKTTGIVTVTYPGNERVRPDGVRLRAANGKARLRRGVTRIENGRLEVSGQTSSRARGVVRIRLEYVDATCRPKLLTGRARIKKGRWTLRRALPQQAAAQGGQLSIRFTGYEKARMRGEQTAKRVGAG